VVSNNIFSSVSAAMKVHLFSSSSSSSDFLPLDTLKLFLVKFLLEWMSLGYHGQDMVLQFAGYCLMAH
jgi:hypothetical protein